MCLKQSIFFLLIAVYAVNSQPSQFSNLDIFNKIYTFDYNITVAEYLLQGESITTKLRLIFGEYGQSVIRFKNGKSLVAFHNERFECDGTILENGQCNGTLTPVDYSKIENWCYVFRKLKNAGHVCLSTHLLVGDTYSSSGSYYKCDSYDNGEILIMTIDEYNNVCRNIGDDPTYTYYQNVSDPHAVPISKMNAIVNCKNTSTSSNACDFTFDEEEALTKSLDQLKNLKTAPLIKSKISINMEEVLEYIEGLFLYMRMVFGENGKTVTKYSNGKTLIIKNDVRYKCNGKVETNDECSGQLRPLDYDDKVNFCYVSVVAMKGNQICLSSGIIFSFDKDSKTGELTCLSIGETLIITVNEYQIMCRGMDFNPTYKYIADDQDPLSVMIPYYPNEYVKCQNNEDNVCVFKLYKE